MKAKTPKRVLFWSLFRAAAVKKLRPRLAWPPFGVWFMSGGDASSLQTPTPPPTSAPGELSPKTRQFHIRWRLSGYHGCLKNEKLRNHCLSQLNLSLRVCRCNLSACLEGELDLKKLRLCIGPEHFLFLTGGSSKWQKTVTSLKRLLSAS